MPFLFKNQPTNQNQQKNQNNSKAIKPERIPLHSKTQKPEAKIYKQKTKKTTTKAQTTLWDKRCTKIALHLCRVANCSWAWGLLWTWLIDPVRLPWNKALTWVSFADSFWVGVEVCVHFPLSGLEPCWLERVQALLALLFKCWEILGNIGLQISSYQAGRIIKFIWLG